MSETINDLYLKYAEGVEESLESDRYFQYLFEMVQAGDNTLQQKNRILHKVVDERWIGTIEEGIDAIYNIIDKPRRFVTTKEEVEPAIRKAIELKCPVMIECVIPEDDKVFPMVPAGAAISEVFDGEDLKKKESAK